jgi:hypothetical protein
MSKKSTANAIIYGNSLEVKSRYIHFKTGPFGSDAVECGVLPRMLLKKKVKWEEFGTCDNGKKIWKIEFL